MERHALMTEKLTDRDLLAECGNGSREAFEAFFYQNQKRVFSVALNFFGGDSQAAEDITQQVFLKIFTKIQDFRGDAEITTWLYRITTNACIDEQRRKKRFSFFTDLFGSKEPKTKRTPDEKLERQEISGEVQKALLTIDAKFRLPILLKYVEGLSYREIADVLDCSEGTVASRLNRGNKLLARKLEHLKGEILR
jgi:RNA polymerase sigma-70 factor, ECF subfamily